MPRAMPPKPLSAILAAPEGDLPVRDVLPSLVDQLGHAGTAVLEAPPGAGKTTLVPLALREAAWRTGSIVVLEPRRIAARAAAARMAALLGEPVGRTVGFSTRDERRVSAATEVEVVTEGILVRRLQRDPTLEGVGVVVLDEFHERAIPADLALAFALECRGMVRDDLRVLVMSATLEGGRVADLLAEEGTPAPVVTSHGRIHPVETVHEPVPRDADIGETTGMAVRRALADAMGDLLVFLPGQREIHRAANVLRGLDAEVVPLYGALPPKEQQRALAPVTGRRRIVLATDIAESSLTVPGVRTVVDAGWARRPRFDPNTGMSRLHTVRVSRASADQRRGRAAREGPGRCVRLWPDTEALVEQSPPSIAEEDLAPTALEVAAWGTPVDELALLDQPPAATWDAAVELLRGLDGLDVDGRLTDHGRAMAALPVHPRLAHMALRAAPEEQRLAAELAALLAERDVLVGGDADIERRVKALRGQRVGAVRAPTLKRVRQDADRLHTRLGGGKGAPLDAAGRLLASAYPDRIAKRRARRGDFVMAGGRGASLPESDPLAGEELLAVADVDRGSTVARIYLAAGLDATDVEPLVGVRAHVAWEDGDVVARRQRVLGALVLSDSPLADPDPEAVREALVEGVRRTGLHLLPWRKTVQGLRDRLGHLHRAAADDGWPPMDDEALLDTLEDWLAPFLTTARRRADLGKVDLAAALMSRVPYQLHSRVDELAPTHVTVPTGSRIRVDYAGARPVLAVRLQEMFGATKTPTVAGEPVLLHLLSPAQRPVQVTDDLAGFWAGSYAQVRAEMRGRYPKHPWPENPAEATPTRRAKPRKRG